MAIDLPEYLRIVSDNKAIIKEVLEQTTLEARLKAIESKNVPEEQLEIVKDYLIQHELEKILEIYKDQRKWQATLRIGGIIHNRPTYQLGSVVREMRGEDNDARKVFEACCDEAYITKIWNVDDATHKSDRMSLLSHMGIMALQLDPGDNINVEFTKITNPTKFKELARKLLYGLMCQDLTHGYDQGKGTYTLLGSAVSSFIQ
ncbi:TPA: hypothetical protein HA246_05825 [Candidatus Woesearchaeota archaeon]|nr:hypothetical protein [Candidatus Woesearchaeota archaeon]